MPEGNRFSHIDLRVHDASASVPFYERLLPALGFRHAGQDPEWWVFNADGTFPSRPFLAITEDPDHRPNRNRVAFWAESPEDVDRLAAIVRDAGGRDLSGPRACPEYSPTYYGLFFTDPSGNPLEVCYRAD